MKYVNSLSRSASHHYKEYSIPKRSGGQRTIHHPSKALKSAQRWLLHEILENLPVHRCSKAYTKGSNTLSNAEPHAGSRYLLRMDLQDFFPSISAADIRTYVRLNPTWFQGWERQDVDVFCHLMCRDGVLPMGAPTSPRLSNALCYELDERLSVLVARNAVTYTRYADDLFFSTQERNVLRRVENLVPAVLAGLSCPANLRINPGKTRHSSKIGARRVTGITLGSDGRTHLGRAVKRRIRAMIFCFETLSAEERASLRGWIAYAIGVEPDFLNSLIAKYGLPLVRRSQGG